MPASPKILVRAPSASFRDATAVYFDPSPIDVEKALVQHARYVGLLRQFGADVEELAPLQDQPDATFVEDCAVIAAGVALIARPGLRSRRAEVASVRAALETEMEVFELAPGAQLDGGDVLSINSQLFVGVGGRTNQIAVSELERVFSRFGHRVESIPLPKGHLHLKCVCSAIDGTVVAVRSEPMERIFEGLDVIWVPDSASYAANLVAIGRQVLVPSGFSPVLEQLRAADFSPVELDMSEFRKADGSLTCLSLRF